MCEVSEIELRFYLFYLLSASFWKLKNRGYVTEIQKN